MPRSQLVILTAVAISSLAFSVPARAQWTDVGRTAKGFNTSYRPAVTRTDDGTTEHVEVYAIEAGTNQVLQMEVDITHNMHTGWNPLGGVVASSPTAVAWNGRREMYVLGTDNRLYRLYSVNGGQWTWQGLGPTNMPLCTDPSAASWGPGRIDIFAGGCDDGNLWHVACANNGCNWETRAAASTIYAVAAAAYAGARLDVWVSEINPTNWNLVDFQYNGSGWNVWNTQSDVFGPVTGSWFVFAGTPNPSVSHNTTNSGFLVTTVAGPGKLWGAGGTTNQNPTSMNRSDPQNMSPPIPQFARPAIANEDSFGEVYLRDGSSHMIRWQALWSENSGINPGFFQISSQTLDTADTFASDPGVVSLDGPTSNRGIRVFAVNSNGEMYMGSDSAQ